MGKTKTLTFTIDPKKILNSNSMPNSWFVKSSKAAYLRSLGSSVGVDNHDDKTLSKAVLAYSTLYSEIVNTKAQTVKKLKKEGVTETELEEEIKRFDTAHPLPERVNFTPMFQSFRVEVKVYPPTARRIDPVNLYPTCKPIIDGLTDCGWWDDDDYTHLKKISFMYGGVSPVKKHFTIELTVEEDENL